ncbi:hypothetical protein E8E11_007730 [Didymella keratinophila]|nr:hypothetical protein E8E11_007730 [Didymella keratinophila]
MVRRLALMALPNELLDAICARLDRCSRCALALTCKATKPSATAALYKTYTNRTNPIDAPFYLFLCTLCENAELATLVKEIDIRGWRSEHEVANGLAWRPMTTCPEKEDEPLTRTRPLFTSTERLLTTLRKVNPAASQEIFQLFLSTAAKIGLVAMPDPTHPIPALKKTHDLDKALNQDADFIRLLKHGVEDAHFILIVAQLPRLEKLLVDGLTPFPLLDWHQFFSRIETAVRSVKILNLWCARVRNEERPVKSTLQIVNILPNLWFLQLAGMSVQGHRHSAEDTLPGRKLKIISFRDCAVRHRFIKKITDGQRIERFFYTPGSPQLRVNQGAAFTEKQILGHLESSEHSLESLCMYPMGDFEQTCMRQLPPRTLTQITTYIGKHAGKILEEAEIKLKLEEAE